jgi:hypothetical protein
MTVAPMAHVSVINVTHLVTTISTDSRRYVTASEFHSLDAA